MPAALFIIIALAGLAITISRLTSGTFSTSVQEAISVQSLYAAESGAQYAMHKLLFNVTSGTEADSNCTNINGSVLNYTAIGLTGCRAILSCTNTSNLAGSARIYDVQSAGSCGGGDLTAERTIGVKAVYE